MRASNTSAICIDTSHANSDIGVISRSSVGPPLGLSHLLAGTGRASCLWSAPRRSIINSSAGFRGGSKVEFSKSSSVKEVPADPATLLRLCEATFRKSPPERAALRLRIPNICCQWPNMTSGLSITPAKCLSHERVRRATELGTSYRGQRDAA
jgi:hypothetical protein